MLTEEARESMARFKYYHGIRKLNKLMRLYTSGVSFEQMAKELDMPERTMNYWLKRMYSVDKTELTLDE